jgi:murein DD-endopeptidase MepM/ murein hydrolase activator NlpD
MSSPFGPRLKASANYTYEFHSGIDIPGTQGVDKAYAFADGEVFRTYLASDPTSPYPNGGNVVIIRHIADVPIPIHGMTFTTYYSLYLHLDSISIPLVPVGGPYPKITKGTQVGYVGHSGTTEFSHLHFEIRVGTTCSLEYQINNPTASCAKTFGSTPKDPHVNPFMLLPYDNNKNVNAAVISTAPLTFRVYGDRNELDFNTLTVTSGSATKQIDLNNQTGIDPTNLNNNSYNGIVLLPAKFNTSSPDYELDIQFTDWTTFTQVDATDMWGNGVRLQNSATPTPTLTIKQGDANGDGKVDETDYGIWLSHFATTVTGGASVGDFDGNGIVDGVDYSIWLKNYGT